MTGSRKFGCDMCGRGQRMLEYIGELEEKVDELEAKLDEKGTTEPTSGPEQASDE